MDPLLLFGTLRHLRWEQLVYRPLRVAQYSLYRAFPPLTSGWTNPNGAAPDVASETISLFRTVFGESFAHLNTPLEEYDQRLVDLAEGRHTFLNRTLKLNPIDWNRRCESHLWNYQLHYFDFAVWCARALVERGDEKAWRYCQSLIESWIEQARAGRSDGWDAYPVSLRVVNWIYAYALVAEVGDDQQFLAAWRASIYRQLDFLSRHLEFHLLANHLLKNVKALVIGGLFFSHERWLTAGERLLWREFEEQVLEDGGHYERSPMYHAQATVDFFECYALLGAFNRLPPNAGEVESKLRLMAGFLEAMSYADGTLALFNDSANTEETRPKPIIETAKRVCGYKEKNFPREFFQTGYCLWISPDEREKLIADIGPPSVNYNTAHAHCDLLSYELWLDGRPFIVDSGVHGYGGDRFREYCRSTRAHNTVMFDGREQSEVWGTFRMGRRVHLIGVFALGDKLGWNFVGGYRSCYDQRMIHERRVTRTADGEWRFRDQVISGKAEQAISFVHLHPSIEVRKSSEYSLAVEGRAESFKFLIEPVGAAAVEIITGAESPIQGWHFPGFGIAQPNATIIFDYQLRGEPKVFGYTIKRLTNG